MKKRSITKFLLVLLLFLSAAGLILYPYVANYVFEHRTDSLVRLVEKTAETVDDSKKQLQMQRAKQYNERLASGYVRLSDPFSEEGDESLEEHYDSILCMTADGVMGFVKIPSINISLPIYHGTSEQTLEAGAGHLKESSFPIGGASTHCVITGHTGLSHAKLFTDLAELKVGDLFFLSVCGETLAYEVDQIKTVFPSDLEELAIIPGKDLCTLVTCTPYGVNSHRLLVRGKRTERTEDMASEAFSSQPVESKWMQEYKRDVLISIGIFTLGIVIFMGIRFVFKSRKGGLLK
ncbi:class C sortase [Parablautia sp. Marseille-Q6255]|uniref:class C sortase n=1 Tax=Parablautia sp. Marseille-Q6255 TaxID=3039593 RepID=UPI0024BD3397|nr:class C sortase [Parablautia sp. Marseille-Q6255]